LSSQHDDEEEEDGDDDLWLSSDMKPAIQTEKDSKHLTEAKSLLSKAKVSKVSLILLIFFLCLLVDYTVTCEQNSVFVFVWYECLVVVR